jgi:hypothetical protein
MNLKKVLEWLSGFSQLEIIVVEQDKIPKLHAYSLKGFKHIYTESKLAMNKGWAYNVGVKYSTTPSLIFGDERTRMDPNKLIEALKNLQRFESVSATNEIIELSQPEMELGFDMLGQINRENKKECFTQGIMMYRKDTLNRVAGWPEEFIGGLGIDEFQSKKTEEITSHLQCENKAFLFPTNKVKENKFLTMRNKELLEKMLPMTSQDIGKYVNNTVQRIGLKMRFADK